MDYIKDIEELIKQLRVAVERKLSTATYDRTSIGCVIAAYDDEEGTGYEVQAFGGKYKIPCSVFLNIGQHVAVLAPQNNFKKLIILNVISDI